LKLNDVGLVHKNQQVIGISQLFLQYHAFIKEEEEEEEEEVDNIHMVFFQ
jgi:hypothetical protein